MRDVSGTHYMVYIFSSDEQASRSQGGRIDCWFRQGDRLYKGNYQVALVPPDGSVAIVQDVALFGVDQHDFTNGVFDVDDNSFKNSAYVIRSDYSGRPDILVVSQLLSESSAEIRVFFIDNGVLHQIYWQLANGMLIKPGESSAGRLANSDFMTFQTHGWARSEEYIGPVNSVWKLDVSRRTFIFVSTIRRG